MGTALGDLAAHTFNLGFFSAGLLFGFVLLALIIACVVYLTITRSDQLDPRTRRDRQIDASLADATRS
jgi:uncharacterized membrane-anchored protein